MGAAYFAEGSIVFVRLHARQVDAPLVESDDAVISKDQTAHWTPPLVYSMYVSETLAAFALELLIQLDLQHVPGSS
jgi:hypothetical protein